MIYSMPLVAQVNEKTPPAPKIKDHTDYAFLKDIWDTPINDFQKEYPNLYFQWQTAKKDALRSALSFPLFGRKSGETLIQSKDGNVSMITFSLYNRGDDEPIDVKTLNATFEEIKKKLDEQTGKKHKDLSKKEAVQLTSYMWKDDVSAYLLEKSSTANTGEFLRLRVAPYRDAKKTNRTASRTSLRSNLTKESNGDTFIENIPMVDQGAKGYCACASSARIFQYYGRNISMHEIAQIAGSTNAGTQVSSMVKAFKDVAGKLNTRVLVLYEYPKHISEGAIPTKDYLSSQKEFVSDVNKYQALSKKEQGELAYKVKGKPGGRVSTFEIAREVLAAESFDPELYKKVMVKKTNFSRFKSNIKKYIKEGIPVGWCLRLGMFKEEGIPQIGGGHMRLIIGYNDKEDTIIYSDSWGSGHEKKSMPIENAYCMTDVLLVMPPTK